MTNEIDRIITEAMEKCWHNFKRYGSPPLQCEKCKVFTGYLSAQGNYPSPSTNWQDYGEVLEWGPGQEWWDDFIVVALDGWGIYEAIECMLNPLRGSTAIAEFIDVMEIYTQEPQTEDKKINTGGPAFPGPAQHEQQEDINEGMTLRDWLAGMALQGILANSSNGTCTPDEYAGEAYLYADAMIKAREVE